VRVLPSEGLLSTAPEGGPLPDSKSEQPPVIRRAEVVAVAQVGLLIIGVVAYFISPRRSFSP